MGSDGVFDNLYDKDVLDCVWSYMAGEYYADPQGSCDCLADKAYVLGKNQDYLSPFAKGAQEAGKVYPNVGKPDDISVVCA